MNEILMCVLLAYLGMGFACWAMLIVEVNLRPARLAGVCLIWPVLFLLPSLTRATWLTK